MSSRRMESHTWDRTLDPDVVPLFLHLQWAHARSLESMRPSLAAHGLSVAEFDVLATLRNAPAPHLLTPSQLQAEAVVTSGGLTKIMLQLEARGLVERPPSPRDQRVKPVRLSTAGARLIEAAMAECLDEAGRWIRSALDAAEIRQVSTLLAKLVDAPAP